MLCSLCPVKFSPSGLSRRCRRRTDWMIGYSPCHRVPVSRPKRHDLEDGNKPDLFETSYQLNLTLTTGEPNHQSSVDRIQCMLGKC